MWYFLSLYMQNVLGYSALRAGLAFLPMALSIIVGAQASSRILPKSGVRPLLLVGTAFATGGFIWMTQIHAQSSYVSHVLGPGSIVALALGVLFTPLASAATAGVHFTEAGLASGVLNTSRQIGGSLGLAALATIATDRTHSVLAAGQGAVASTVALTDGYARAFAGAVLLALGALVCSIVVPSIRDRGGARDTGDVAAPPLALDTPAGLVWDSEPGALAPD
ncbi:MAG: MFS transporter, partial [Acidimicrobiales bacterium]